MKRKKEIMRNRDAFGGYGYRVLGNEDTATIQCRYQNGTWRNVASLERHKFNQWADDVGLHNAFTHNPASLSLLADSLIEE